MHHDELWREYAPNGQPLPGVGHPKAYFEQDHPTAICAYVQVWLYRDTPTGRELLFQLRSPEVQNGNTWDISAAGHINFGETTLEAAIRESHEEIGAKIDPEKLEFTFSFKSVCSFQNVYIYNYTDQPDTFAFNDHEVSDLKWVPLASVPDFRKNGGMKPLLADRDFYWELLLKHLNIQ